MAVTIEIAYSAMIHYKLKQVINLA